MTDNSPERQKCLDAIKRLEGLTKKLRTMIEEEAYCPETLKLLLAMQGHIKHIQGQVLEHHLRGCAPEKLASKDRDTFITELTQVIGLSKR